MRKARETPSDFMRKFDSDEIQRFFFPNNFLKSDLCSFFAGMGFSGIFSGNGTVSIFTVPASFSGSAIRAFLLL